MFFSNSFIVDEVMRAWEVDTVAWEQVDNDYDYGIVLGGLVSYDEEYDRINFLRSNDRLMQALELYNRGKISKIFISGGSGMIDLPDFKEGKILKEFLVRSGVKAEDIEEESISRNTHENAVETKKAIFLKGHNPKCLLITSAFHMRRALACFHNEGMYPDAFVTDRYSGPRKYSLDHLFLPSINAMVQWNMILKEMVGYVAYDFAGYL